MAGDRKRPWYLVLALLGAFAFGVDDACRGWAMIVLYREPIDPSLLANGVTDEADRARLLSRLDAYVHALDAAKSRGWPLGVAALLLGGATLVSAICALAGSGAARAALVQLVVAQAAAGAADHWLLRDVDVAELRMNLDAGELRMFEAQHQAESHERVPDDMLRAAASVALTLQLLGSALIVLGLTRRRARAFFESASASAGE